MYNGGCSNPCYPMYGYPIYQNNNTSSYAIILVLFILLVVVIGARRAR